MAEALTPMALETIEQVAVVAAIAVPALAALAVLAVREPRWRDGAAILGAVLAFALVVWLAAISRVMDGPAVELGEVAPGISIAFAVDGLGLVFALTVAGTLVVAVPYTTWYLRAVDDGAPGRVLAAMVAALAAAIGAAFAANLLVLFAFLEVLTLVTYPLLAHGEDRSSRRRGYVYLAYAFAGGLSVLVGTRIVYAEAGSVAFVRDGIPALATTAAADPWVARWAVIALVVGFAVKAALVPVHSWFVRARATLTPAFGAVFAVVVLTAGTFGIARATLDVIGHDPLAVIGVTPYVLALATVTILIAGTMALAVAGLRERLTYLVIAGGALAVVGLVSGGAGVAVGVAFLPIHAASLLVAFLGLGLLDPDGDRVEPGDRRARLAPLVTGVGAAALVATTVLASLAAGWYLVGDRPVTGWSVATAALVFGAVVHLLALWAAVTALWSPHPPTWDRLALEAYPPPPGGDLVGGPAATVRAMLDTVAVAGERLAVAAALAVRRPGAAIEEVLPDPWQPRYRAHREAALGTTGTKLGIDGSLIVVGVVLALILVIGLV